MIGKWTFLQIIFIWNVSSGVKGLREILFKMEIRVVRKAIKIRQSLQYFSLSAGFSVSVIMFVWKKIDDCLVRSLKLRVGWEKT